jgi:hypothetical protein
MSTLQNSEIISYVLETLIRIIGRRSSENFALITIDTIMKQLQSKYNSLKYIEIKNTLYSEGIEAIGINPNINKVETRDLVNAIAELLDVMTNALGKGARYHFIKEIKDDLEPEIQSIFKEYGLDLTFKHFEYLTTIKETEKSRMPRAKNSESVKPVLKALLQLLNRHVPEADAIKKVITTIKKFEGDYKFLKYIEISDTPTMNGFYTIKTKLALDEVLSSKMGEALQKIIEDVGRSIDARTRRSFIEDYKIALGAGNRSKIKEISVDLEHIEKRLRQQGHELLCKKTLEVIIELMSTKTSKSFAVASFDTVLEKLQNKHKVLKYITIDKTLYDNGIDAITIMPEINTVESHELGKAIEEILERIREHLEDKNQPFIEEFENKMGREYLSEIEKLGVNLHILELRFV